MNSPLFRADRFLTRYTDRKLLPLRAARGVVSFTFDDAPLSACVAGAAALERHGARGTWYVAGGLTDGSELGRPCHTEAALRDLLAAGHQLGCHTWSHVEVNRIDHARRIGELDRSKAWLAGLGVNLETLDFAYPLGGVSIGAKHDCAGRFRSSRATGRGAHIGSADLNALKTHRFYRSAPDAAAYAERLAQTAAQRGWLILNTHEVADDAGPYGCSPQELRTAIGQALDAGCLVLPVTAALDYLTAAAAA